MNQIEPSRICEVAGHAWVVTKDKWGQWYQCQRCSDIRKAPQANAAEKDVT